LNEPNQLGKEFQPQIDTDETRISGERTRLACWLFGSFLNALAFTIARAKIPGFLLS
jgi:hypothetical protein